MKASIFLLSALLIVSLGQNVPPQNPVIGIYTQTLSNTTTDKSSYIAASYVKFIEMSGAQVVPIYSFANTSDILTLLGKINGVLFPGQSFLILRWRHVVLTQQSMDKEC
jgi:agmatine/peptidylarginine deiminase